MATLRNASRRGFADLPRRGRAPSLTDLVGSPEARRVQVDAAYRREVRQARAEGRAPVQRRSIARRFQRYGRYATGEGAQRRQPSRQELGRMRRAYHAEERRRTEDQTFRENARRAAEQGARIELVRPYLVVSDERRARPRAKIEVELGAGQLDEYARAVERGDLAGADEELTKVILAQFAGDLEGQDMRITQVDAVSVFLNRG